MLAGTFYMAYNSKQFMLNFLGQKNDYRNTWLNMNGFAQWD